MWASSLLVMASVAYGQSALPTTRQLATQRMAVQIQASLREKNSRTPAMRKMSSELIFAVRQLHGYDFKKDLPKLRIPNVVRRDGTVDFQLQGAVTSALLTQIQRLHGQVFTALPAYGSLTGRIPVRSLESLAMLPGVRFVREPERYSGNSGSVQSQGDVSLRADLARTDFGLSGAGVKVGVMSDSNTYQENSQSTGDLPATVTIPNGNDGRAFSSHGEGTAMMEIVHDLAPNSPLYYNTAYDSQPLFAQHYRDLFAAGCTVITDDVFYYDEPAFQDGPVAKAVNDITKAGGIVFVAAGNQGNKLNGKSGVWEGDYNDNGNGFHNFSAAGDEFNDITATGTGYMSLQWNDKFGSCSSDYDLYVIDSNGNVVGKGDTNNVGNDPVEHVMGAAAGDSVAVAKFSGNNYVLRVNEIGGQMDIVTGGQIWGHNASELGNGVATINAATSPTRAFTASDVPTYYSSDGPRRVYYNDAGTQIAANLTFAGAVIRKQPAITGVDGVSTTVPGLTTFYGTSAAAPHTAAVAALLREFAPDATSDQIRNALINGSIDVLTAGYDVTSGYGAVNTLGAIKVLIEAKTQGVTPTTGTVAGTTPVSLSLNLGRNAPPAGIKVNVTATGDTSKFTIPSTFNVAAGSSSASFSVGASGTGTGTATLTLKENYTGALLGTVVVNRTADSGPTVASVTLDPTEVVGASRNVSGKVTLSANATSTYVVELQSSNTAVATVPATVSISSGGNFKTFVVTSYPVTTDTTVTIRARKSGSTGAYTEATLSVKAPAPISCVPSPTSGLPGTSVTFTVKLNGPAPTVGIAVGLVTTDATILAVPRTLTIPVGATTASFTDTVGPSQTKKTVTVSVRYKSATVAQGRFAVLVPEVSNLSVSPNPVKGGVNATGTVTLASAAPTGGTLVTLSKSGTGATIPVSVTVAAGQTTATFTVTTSTVTKNTNFKIAAKTATVSKTVTLVITP